MSEYYLFIITTLVPEWTSGGETFGPSIIKWLLKVKISDVEGEFGWDSKKVIAELMKRQPQLSGDKVVEIEQTNINIA